MKNITLLIISLFLISCAQNNEEYNQLKADKEYVESNVNMYSDVWNAVFSEKNIDLVTSENFHEDVTVVTYSIMVSKSIEASKIINGII